MNQEINSMKQLLDRVGRTAENHEQVSLEEVMGAIGRRSFGPLILLAGLVTLAPIIGDMPGIPTIMAIFVLLTAGQLLFRRKHFWLPSWLLRRSVSRDRIGKLLKWLRPAGRFFDWFLRERLTFLTRDAGLYLIAVACIAVAVAMPVMEVVPFSANLGGAALTIFGLALIARDGALALAAFIFTLLCFWVIGSTLIW